ALLPGMTANLQIVTDEREDVLRIPNAALRFRPPAALMASEARSAPSEGQEPRRRARRDQAASDQDEGARGRVYRVGDDGNPQPVPVRLGATDGAYTEILRGDLQEGAAIIVGAARADAADNANGGARSRPRPPRMF
ncbi:hypothetical protein ACFSM9_24050, partial [Microvirga arabica]